MGMVRAGIVEGVSERSRCEHRPRLLFDLFDGGRATQLDDGIDDADTLAKSGNTDFRLENVGIELKQDVTCDFLLCDKGKYYGPLMDPDMTYQ